MIELLNFEIKSLKQISRVFLENNVFTFSHAILFVKQLSYKRNTNKNDLTTLFVDNCGTCSTKHTLLKQLVDEN